MSVTNRPGITICIAIVTSIRITTYKVTNQILPYLVATQWQFSYELTGYDRGANCFNKL